MKKDIVRRNKYAFGLGTIGRDMVYSLVSMYLMVYITEVVNVTDAELAAVTTIILLARIFDAANDPFMGVIVDNTHSRFGKYKPWIALGALLSGLLTVILYTDFGLSGTGFIVVFGIVYVLWGVSFTINDISYWSMMPSLSDKQKDREKIGAFARIFANIGLFAVVGSIIPVTNALGESFGSMKKGYFIFAVAVVIVMIAGQCITLFGVIEPKIATEKPEKTTIKGMLQALFRNDQLLLTGICMALFMIGYETTAAFGVYFFKYAYGDENMYVSFAVILGVSQISALIIFPLFSKKYTRKQLYSAASILILAGYILFFVSPMNMLFLGTAGVMMFVGQAFIQLLMLVFLADTVEYGEWKLGRRNESVTFAIQPFINKIGGAIASGIVGMTLIISGINSLEEGAAPAALGLTFMKIMMLIFPMITILLSYVVYRWKFKLDKETYDTIVSELEVRRSSAKVEKNDYNIDR